MDHWLTWKDGALLIETPALKQPKLSLWPFDLQEGGEWIYQKGENLVREVDGRQEVLRKAAGVRFVRVGEDIEQVRLIGHLEFLGEEYDEVQEYLGTIVLLNGKKVTVLSGGKTWSTDRGKVTVRGKYVSVAKNGLTDVWNGEEVFTVNGEGYVVGQVSSRVVFREKNGIVREAGGGIIGFCGGDTYLLGETRGRTVIWCGGSVRLLMRDGWRELGKSASPLSCSAGENFAVIVGEETTITNIFDFSKVSGLRRVYRSAVDEKRAFLTSEDGTLGILDVSEEGGEVVNVLSQVTEGRGAKLAISGPGEVKIGNELVEVAREDGEEMVIEVEPRWLEPVVGKVTVENMFWSSINEVWIEAPPPQVEVEGVEAKVAPLGKYKYGEGNSVVFLKVHYSIPGAIGCSLIVEAMGKSQAFIAKGKGECSARLVGTLSQPSPFEVRVSLRRFEKVLTTLSKTVTPTIINKPDSQPVRSKSRWGNVEEERTVWTDGEFVWSAISRNQVDYRGVLFRRVGEYSEIIGGRVEKGIRKVLWRGREFMIVGVEDPLEEAKVEIEGSWVVVKTTNYSPIEVIHGLRSARGIKEVRVPLDPPYTEIRVRAYESGLTWERTFKTDIVLHLSIAVKDALSMFRELESYGVVSV
ncbi:protein UpsX [Sulfodiicoccus acidiphilus]|nr:hypothetical protein [Sulfodiicoccus acidiphilus]